MPEWQTLGEEGMFARVLDEAMRAQRAAQARAATPTDPSPDRCGVCGQPVRSGECCGDVPDQWASA